MALEDDMARLSLPTVEPALDETSDVGEASQATIEAQPSLADLTAPLDERLLVRREQERGRAIT